MSAPKKKVTAVVGITIGAGKANPAPPVGTALGPRGINIPLFCTEFNNATKNLKQGAPTPVEITIYADKTFSFRVKNPPTSYLILERTEPLVDKGSKTPGKDVVAKIKMDKIKEVAKIKMDEMSVNSIEAAVMNVRGTALSMGVEVVE
jgi:large subunit ribosomal protein L11